MIRTDLSNAEYHADISSYSSSALKLYLKDPVAFHKKYILGEPDGPTPAPLQAAFDIGSYIHTLILEPHLIEEEYVIGKTEDKEELLKDTKDKTFISNEQDKLSERMMKNFEKSSVYPEGKTYKSFFERGLAEESMFTELHGLPIKIRTDYRKHKNNYASINDVKTTSKKITLDNIKKVCDDLHYDLSAALYVDVAKEVTGIEHDFYLLFLGKKDFKCELVRASSEFLERGRVKYLKAIRGIKKSLETGVWIAEI